jgi:hypothetical protein
MDDDRTRDRSERVISEDGREAIELRITTVEPARGKDPDAAVTVSATARSRGRTRVSATSCSASARATTTGSAMSTKKAFAKASTPRLRSTLH